MPNGEDDSKEIAELAAENAKLKKYIAYHDGHCDDWYCWSIQEQLDHDELKDEPPV